MMKENVLKIKTCLCAEGFDCTQVWPEATLAVLRFNVRHKAQSHLFDVVLAFL